MPTLRVCHINLSKEFRGGERQTLALIQALPASVEQRAVVRRNSLLHKALAAEPSLRSAIVAIPNSPVAAVRASAGVDLVHAHDGRSVAVGALRSVLGTPFIATRRIARAPTRRRMTRWSYSRARCIVGVSGAVAKIMRAYDEHTETRTIYDCAPALRRPAAAAVQAIRERFAGKLLFGQVGQLDDAMKGQRLTIAAAGRLESLRSNVQFLLIGEGRDEQALKAEARHMSNVQFTGWRSGIEDYYAALDVLVFPSRSEGLGSAILEAMSFGIPVVAAAVGGIPEVIDAGSNGMLFPAGDVGELTAQLTRIADATELRRELGRRSVLTAALMSPERMAEQYVDLYQTVVAQE